MSTPSYIRSIQTSFTAGLPSASPWASVSYASSSSGCQSRVSELMNRYPPGLGVGSEWRGPSSSVATGRKRAASFRIASTSRRPPPPPPTSRIQPASISYSSKSAFDPFSDDASYTPSIPTSYSRITNHTPSAYTQPRNRLYTITIPPSMEIAPNPVQDRTARSKLVAGILLNRVHAVGKPMRRRPGTEPRAYVKSGLSSVVSVEA